MNCRKIRNCLFSLKWIFFVKKKYKERSDIHETGKGKKSLINSFELEEAEDEGNKKEEVIGIEHRRVNPIRTFVVKYFCGREKMYRHSHREKSTKGKRRESVLLVSFFFCLFVLLLI